jgi:hypothetical protein
VKLLLRLCAVVMVVVCATWAYRVNYATQEALNRVADLEDAIAAEHEALAVLEAEWAYLNRPDRLRALVADNAEALGLVELTPDRFGDVAMVAYPPEPEPEPEAVASADGTAGPGAPKASPGAAVHPRVAQASDAARPKPAAGKPAVPKPVVRREAAARPAAPRRETVASAPRLPVTLQDLVNAVAGARP